MSIRTVHLVTCDRCGDAEHIPHRSYTPTGARADAADNGWDGPTPETPAAEDLCPGCVKAATPTRPEEHQ